MDEFKNRRDKLLTHMQNDSIFLLAGAKMQYRNNDVQYVFRQDSDFYYLSGFNEADAVMALIKDDKGIAKYVLFNLANDQHAEIWNGKRAGQNGARAIYAADEAYDINDIDRVMPNLLVNKRTIYYPLAANQEFDLQILAWLRTTKLNFTHKNKSEDAALKFVPEILMDIMPFIHEMRLFKSTQEIASMRKAAEVSALAHTKLMQTCKPGQMEYQLEAIFNQYCLDAGCRGLAYQSIVAGGNNSCILHYVNNDQVLKDGELVLVDAGAEYNYYAADITRTFPVNGKFTSEQKEIYSLVLAAQLAGITAIKPGNTFDRVQAVILQVIVTGLVRLGLLHGEVEELIKNKAYQKFYMHSSGHWLGLDVHDVGKYKLNGKWREFVPGMVLTVEPGIYIAANSIDVESKWLGIGVRIEDDVLVTEHGHEVLSHKVPKKIAEIERAAI